MNAGGNGLIDNGPQKQDLKPEVKLADDHWKWVQGLIDRLERVLTDDAVEYLYKTAFVHGWKHAKRDSSK